MDAIYMEIDHTNADLAINIILRHIFPIWQQTIVHFFFDRVSCSAVLGSLQNLLEDFSIKEKNGKGGRDYIELGIAIATDQ